MKTVAVFFSLLIFCLCAFAQEKPGAVLATANNQTFTANDLSPEAQQSLENLPAAIGDLRARLLEQQIVDAMLEAEAAAQKTTVDKLIETEVNKKVSMPTAQAIQAIYDANRAQIGGKTLEEVRPQIVEFLQSDEKRKIYGEYLSNLKTKYKAALLKDINQKNLSPFDTVAAVGEQRISSQSFESKNKSALNDFEANTYDGVRAALEQIVYSNLLLAEAKAQNIDAADLIAREITDKAGATASDYDRERLASALRKRLFQKYNARFFVKEIPSVALAVSADDDPSQGSINAPVTVVMFSDFQCSHCAATHPIVKQVLSEFPAGKVRFVVRDFPLTNIHADAFRAALAADAANAQGKFFEYIELLYANQDALDANSLKQYATKIGLDRKRFEADLDSEKYAAEVRKDMEDGKKYGITGTPTIFVNGVKIRQFSPENFRNEIDKFLNK